MDKATHVLIDVFFISLCLAKFLLNTSRIIEAVKLCKECLILISNKALEKEQTFVNLSYIAVYRTMIKGYRLNSDHASATECCRNLLEIVRRCGKRDEEGRVIYELASLYQRQCNYKEAKHLYEEALRILIETVEIRGELLCYGNLGTVFQCLGEYVKAEEYIQKALAICKELGDRIGEASCYGNLGTCFQSLSNYSKAEEYIMQALAIRREIGDRQGEGEAYGNLGAVFYCRGEYEKAKEFFQKGLAIKTEIRDKHGEATYYGNLGTVFQSLGKYAQAQEYLQKGLAISKEIGDREGEAANYGNLATVSQSLGRYAEAEEYLQKSLPIRKDIGDRCGEAADYGNLGTLFYSRGEYAKAEEHLEKSLSIREKIGDRHGEASCYGNLGPVFMSLGEYLKAEEYLQKALAIRKEIGDRQGEAVDYANLDTVLHSIGEYRQAEEYLPKSLAILKEIGDRKGEASCYEKTGGKFVRLGEYDKAEKFLQKSLDIRQEIGDRKGEASCHGKLGTVFRCLGEYKKAQEYLQKAVEIVKEIGDRREEAIHCRNLGNIFQSLGDYAKAGEHHVKALVMSQEIGDIEAEFNCFFELAVNALLEGNIDGASLYLFASIQTCEIIRTSLRDNDQFKVSFLDAGYVLPYRMLSELYRSVGCPTLALWIVELGRGRALADLLSAHYSFQQVPVKAELLLDNFRKSIFAVSTFLYISYFSKNLSLWILKPNNQSYLRTIDANACLNNMGSAVSRNVDEIFGNESFRRLHVNFTQLHCEDRSLFPSVTNQLNRESSLTDSSAVLRLVEEDEDENQQLDPDLAECYKMLIAPIVDLLEETTELIIVPDRCLYKVPFAALKSEAEDVNGNYLSDRFRIRIIPSLLSLGLIQNCPVNYHSQTGALIVGEPKVDQVFYKGRTEKLCPLPSARKEAEMIGRLLGIQPLLGEQATKQTVLQSIHSVALIHFAAHGNAERGEIALAPQHPDNGIPQEGDYLLTMAEISQVRLRAKLVVLSCCHSAHGQITSDGVVGIARAFLGSGARSVLVALWALEDKATEQFMSRFYKHLVEGKSASESLHQAMKWMRANSYSDVGQWAPFMLIGDNVTFDFGK